MALMGNAPPKPRRGDYWIEKRKQRADRDAAEDRIMQAALSRDLRTCRFPKCPFAKKGMLIDPAHFLQHRGMGGNPSGERTERTGQIVALCRRHHDDLDKYGQIEIHVMDSAREADGPLAWYQRNNETGQMEHIYTEPIRYISEQR